MTPTNMSLTTASTLPTSLYAELATRLPADVLDRLEEVFDASQVIDDAGQLYKVGTIIREAWRKEDAIEAASIDEVAALLVNLFKVKSISGYTSPNCCGYHRRLFASQFSHPAYYPPDEELLQVVAQLIWALLPRSRGTLRMNGGVKAKTYTTSRFMMFDGFLERHDRGLLRRSKLIADVRDEYEDMFSPSRQTKLRRTDVRRYINSGLMVGMVSARPEIDPAGTGTIAYCGERRPFSTPTPPTYEIDRSTAPPEALLHKLGLQFNAGQKVVELVYRVKIEPNRAGASKRATAPTVIDSEGYWLFWPDRPPAGTDGMLWNYTRDVATNRRGRRELIAPSVPVSRLTDLIVWQKRTTKNWAQGAAADLSANLAV